ncbi:MAG: cyclic nucleotide-binding domain-containing protein [Betaproteobacteria bacterium]|nr:cyclic nucleotide-binding domain-containing protein [Betaproteobacteria bacterium]
MKKVLDFLRNGRPGGDAEAEREGFPESQFFSTGFHDASASPGGLLEWGERARALGARRLPHEPGARRLRELWTQDRFMAGLSGAELDKCARHFQFWAVDADRDIIEQNEHGSFMLIVLHGVIAVDRQQPWGERVRLTESRAGSVLGEMSLLDAGPRASYCTTLRPSEIAVLEARMLDELIERDPASAVRIVGSLARRLSLRLRKLGAPTVGTSA